jgi:hypothetical protein
MVQVSLGENITRAKRARDMAQVVECILRKHEALRSNSSTAKEK